MNVAKELESSLGCAGDIRLNRINVHPETIRAVMINEIVPEKSGQDFYEDTGEFYLSSVLPLFQKAGFDFNGISDILETGVYLTNAVKTPKTSVQVEKSQMEESLPWLEKELSLFPNVRVIMLMGDVAKKMFNQIVKKHTKKNAVPSGATYKIRKMPYFVGNIRVMPSYIITGGNLLIEKSKCAMIQEDIAEMYRIIKG